MAAQGDVMLPDIRRANGDGAGRTEDLKELVDAGQFGELAE